MEQRLHDILPDNRRNLKFAERRPDALSEARKRSENID